MMLMQLTGMKKAFLLLSLVICSLVSITSGQAQPAEYHFGGGIINFDYVEYDDNNRFLDGESGLIPGVIFKRKQYHQKLLHELVLQLHGNEIEYDGQTQDGVPTKTDSIAIIFDGHYKVGMRLAGNHEPYLGLGYRYWYRHIQNGRDNTGRPVAGLLEHYKWFYWLVGYAADFRTSDTVSVGYDFRYTKMFNSTMDIDFLGFCDYDDAQVDLGNRAGARFALPVKIKTRQHDFTITPYYELIDIGKSNTVALTRNGNLVDCDSDGFYDGALEPRSETRNVGIEFTWLW